MIWVDKAGATCGGYTILKTLGRGGNAVVKLVEKDNQLYAMKIFKSEKFGQANVQYVEKEMEIVSRLNLKNIPKYYEFREDWRIKKSGQKMKVFFLVMEFIDGVTLFDFFFKVGRTEDKFLRYVFRQVASSLHKLHQAGIAHRDIKPENVMLTESFDVKLIDLGYGISLAGSMNDGFTRTKLGTDMYMAPEIVENKIYQGADVDIFALGVMLLTLKGMLYPFDSANMMDQHFCAL